MTERKRPGFAGMFQGPPDLAATAKDRVRGQGEYSESAIRADERRKVLRELHEWAWSRQALGYQQIPFGHLYEKIKRVAGDDD